MIPILTILLTAIFAIKEMWAAMTIVLILGRGFILLVDMKD